MFYSFIDLYTSASRQLHRDRVLRGTGREENSAKFLWIAKLSGGNECSKQRVSESLSFSTACMKLLRPRSRRPCRRYLFPHHALDVQHAAINTRAVQTASDRLLQQC